ncbi:MAG TPA: sulfatase-like hydrolase/transferase, partial [Candidatus Polarisedimenticolia bacterium]|nr:sulfatase-like hydrolase/transferase [Candidatus Polarisedimenticolia bacterium]
MTQSSSPRRTRKPHGSGSLGWFLLCLVAACVTTFELASHAWADSPPPGKSSSPAPAPSSLVLITVEGLRPDYLTCYRKGSATKTPEIDKLAAGSWLFEQVVTPSVSTLPALATLLTGRTPFQHGVWDDDYRNKLPEKEATLAEILQAKGYRTGAFLGTSRMAVGRGFDQGFDLFQDGYVPLPSGGWRLLPRPAQSVVGGATSWLNGIADRPFFLWVHFVDPAMPGKGAIPLPSADLLSTYRERVKTLDSEVGRLLAALKSRKDYSKMLVVLTADHGMGLGDHGERRSGSFLYESTLRVPLILKTPEGSGAGGGRVRELAGLVDVFPSLQRLLGLPTPAGLRGRDLLEAVKTATVSYPSTALMGREVFGWAGKESVAQGPWRLILSPRAELYDLGADPGQNRDFSGSRPSEVARLKGLLAALADGARIPPAHFLEGSGPDPGLNKKLTEMGLAPATREAALRRVLPEPKKFGDALPLIEEMHFFTEALGFTVMRKLQGDLLKADPEALFTLVGLSSLSRDSGQEEKERAGAMLRTAQKLYPLEPEIYHSLAHAALAERRHADAESLLRVALSLSPRYPAEILYDLACARALRGDKIGALS